MTHDWLKQFRSARRCGVPLLAVNTADPARVVQAIRAESAALDAVLLGDPESGVTAPAPIVLWDVIEGLSGADDAGKQAAAAMTDGEYDGTRSNPTEALVAAKRLPVRGILIIHQADRWLRAEHLIGYAQAAWNLRDRYKSSERMLVLVGKSIKLPADLADDVVVLDEPLPDDAALEAIVRDQHTFAGLPLDGRDETVGRAVEAVRGLSAFAAEQVTAVSLTKAGINLDGLWERKRRQVEQTPGLTLHRGADRFESIGGVNVVKDFLARIMRGRSRPGVVVFIDEIEKMLGGASGGDLSGVSQDQLGTLLSYMQDHGCAGSIFIGPPGAAKSAVAKAAGNEGGVPTVQLDLGASKGSLVGQSEERIREALKVVTAIAGEGSLWIATCNSITDLPPELRRRFTLGTFFFNLPDAEERRAIWDIYLTRYCMASAGLPNDEGWTGAEIKQACDIAFRLGCSLAEAAEYIVPVSRSAADQIRLLTEQADGRFLSASRPGVYRLDPDAGTNASAANGGRKVRL